MKPSVMLYVVGALAIFIAGVQVGIRNARREVPAVLSIPPDSIPVQISTRTPDGLPMTLRFACTGYAKIGEREDVVQMAVERTQ